MKIREYKFNNTETKFKNKKIFFFESYPDSVNIFLIDNGNWIKIYNNDANVISNFHKIKLSKQRDGDLSCIIHISNLNKIKNKLEENKINYNIINTTEHIYLVYDFDDQNCYNKYKNTIIENRIDINEEKVIDKKIKPSEITNKNIEAKLKTNITSKKKIVSIGDTIKIKNMKTNEEEVYKIVKAYYTAKPVGISRSHKSWGKIISKPEMIIDYSIENNEINSESPFAKALLDCYEGQKVNLIDKDGNDAEYIIKSIN